MKRKTIYGYLFILPWLIGFLALVLWPIIQSIYFSLNNMRITPIGLQYNFVGLKNYLDVWLKDMFFIQELLQFLLNTPLRLPVIVVFALMIALLLNEHIRFRGMFRTIFFLPVIVASGPVMNMLIEQDRKSTRLNSSHVSISYAAFCLHK